MKNQEKKYLYRIVFNGYSHHICLLEEDGKVYDFEFNNHPTAWCKTEENAIKRWNQYLKKQEALNENPYIKEHKFEVYDWHVEKIEA